MQRINEFKFHLTLICTPCDLDSESTVNHLIFQQAAIGAVQWYGRIINLLMHVTRLKPRTRALRAQIIC